MRAKTAALVVAMLVSVPYLALFPLEALPVQGADGGVQPPGEPLPPGTVSYQNTWGVPPLRECSPRVTTEPLLPRADSWTFEVAIPSLLFLEEPTGEFITHTYTFHPNGTFVAQDDRGNEFGWTGLGGLPGALVQTSLEGNSTAVAQRYVVVRNGQILANVSVSYAVRYEFCAPAGLKIAIAGQANWGPASVGTIALAFTKTPVLAEESRAWFGNNSDIWLGFDWSDALGYAPSLDNVTARLGFQVGASFDIDPSTVATSSASTATYNADQRKTLRDLGRYWVFYNSGGSGVVLRTSEDGLTWSSATTIVSTTYTEGQRFSVWHDRVSHKVYYVHCEFDKFKFRFGTLQANGSIAWAINEESKATLKGKCHTAVNKGSPTISLDSAGNVYVAITVKNTAGTPSYEVWKRTPGGIWSQVFAWGNSDAYVIVLTLTGTKVLLLRGTTSGNVGILWSADGGGSWDWIITTTSSSYDMRQSAALAVGDAVYFAGVSGSQLLFWDFTWGDSAVGTETTLASSAAQATIATDGASTLFVSYDASSVKYRRSRDLGSSWDSAVNVTAENPNDFSLSGGYWLSENRLTLLWLTGSASPWNVRFASLPTVVPHAGVTSAPWARGGLAPYEEYFRNLAEYVSPGNGLLTVRQVDLYLPGRGLDVVVARIFSTPYAFLSGSPYNYDNYTLSNIGQGWALDLPWLGPDYLHLWGGQVYQYQWNGSVFENHRGEHFKLVKNVDNTYSLYSKAGTKYQFDTGQKLVSITDRTGNNTITFTYSSNRIATLTDTVGRNVTFTYDGSNRLSSISSGGRTWTYAYNGSNLASATDPLNRTTTYVYSTGINTWLMSGVRYPTGGNTTYSYGSAPVGTEATTYYVTLQNIYASAAALSRSSSFSYNLVDGSVTATNVAASDGIAIRAIANYTYLSGPSGMNRTERDGAGTFLRMYEYRYDVQNGNTETRLYLTPGVVGATAVSSYDNWGNLKYAKDFIGHETWLSYANTDSYNTFNTTGFTNSFYTNSIASDIHDALVGRAEWQNGPSSAKLETYFKYDSVARLVEQKRLHDGAWPLTNHTYDQYGNRLSTTDALNRTRFFEYGATYQSAYLTLTRIVVNGQNVTHSYTYDFAKGWQLSATDPNGFTTDYAYDALGRLTVLTHPPVNSIRATRLYAYNDTSSVVTITDELGHVVKRYFDGLGRQTKLERYNGSSVYSSATFAYNWLNQLKTKVTPIGSTYSFDHDALGRLLTSTNPDNTTQTAAYDDVNNIRTLTDENGHQTAYGSDRLERLLWVREYYNATQYYQTTYAYHMVGNLVSMTDAKNQVTSHVYDDLNRLVRTDFPDGKNETRNYDSVGNLLSRRDPAGNLINYTYDALDRLTRITYPNASVVDYGYDKAGNRLSLADPAASTTYTYDARNRLTNETRVISGTSYPTLYGYDNASHTVSLTYPDSSALSLTYDALGRVQQVGTFASVTYTLDDQVQTITYGNGIVTTYSYDARSRPTRLLVKSGSTTKLDLNYTFDGHSNVRTINTETYGYDWLDRLTSSTGPWSNLTYTYDAVGNRLTKTEGGSTTNYTYGTYNRLTQFGAANFTYDGNGNLATSNDGTNAWTYSYDYENRLTSAVKNGQTQQTNTYDGDGRRIKKVESSTVLLVYHGTGTCRCGNLVYEKDLNSSIITKYFYAGDLRVAKIVGASTYYFHQDHLGSTRLVTTSTASDNFSSNYQPFGPQHAPTGSELFKYVGQREDGVTGLYAMGARYYSPTVGRFVTQDPLLGISLDPQSLHRYSYARNNPLRYVDPHGLAFRPVGSTSAVTAVLGQTTANLLGPVVTTGTASVTNVLARVAATTTSRKQLIPTVVTTVPGSTSNADSSQDESSDDPYVNPDYIVGDRAVVDPWEYVFNPQDTYTPNPPAPEFTTFGLAVTPSVPCHPEMGRAKRAQGAGIQVQGTWEMIGGFGVMAAAPLAGPFAPVVLLFGAIAVIHGYSTVVEGQRLQFEGLAEELCK